MIAKRLTKKNFSSFDCNELDRQGAFKREVDGNHLSSFAKASAWTHAVCSLARKDSRRCTSLAGDDGLTKSSPQRRATYSR